MVVLGWKVNLVPIIQSWLEAEEFLFNLLLISFNLDSHICLVALVLVQLTIAGVTEIEFLKYKCKLQMGIF